MTDAPTAVQRLAVPADAPAIAELARSSVRALFPAYYDERQTASAATHIAVLDLALIEDGTYYVHEAAGEIVACGGWSRRNKLYNGTDAGADARLLDPATEPARIRAMFVRGDWTRRGLGRAILTACVDAARVEGFGTLALMATLPGVPLYQAFGFTEVEHTDLTMPDGVVLGGVAMERAVD
ncbi:N-acetylglutamate synthase-like GNAT family acetyltransferase [Kribbella amoyensis]|uniref:N-acetylglutamate synthase-like GNAT family acetyltransferase n=1 Tax=Kribbella amoyensis TaxID=996641 RepID=A0A561BMM0_9ACTN|nr:GNAT family N-acetyltransferase [Kribbella amoyensis]TWD80098.1 N-acetylglutamate synthase-like GNAT family acetyltransferase [Kribbella amoyensis]